MALLYSKPQQLGWVVPDFELPDTEGANYSPKNFLNKKGLLIVFTCNHCPYARASWPLLNELFDNFNEEIGFLAISPNDETSFPEDSLENMKKKKVEWNIHFPYLRDQTQEVARSFNAQCTPDPFLFINDSGVFKLYYHGRVNDNWQSPNQVKEKNLEDAILRLTTNQPSPEDQPPSMGCSIKWKSA